MRSVGFDFVMLRRFPWTVNTSDRPAALHICTHGRRSVTRGGPLHSAEQLQRRGAQRDMLDFFLFGVMGGFCPDSALQIELWPLRFQYLAFTGASQEQQAQCIGRVLVW